MGLRRVRAQGERGGLNRCQWTWNGLRSAACSDARILTRRLHRARPRTPTHRLSSRVARTYAPSRASVILCAEQLRAALDAHGLHRTTIVGADHPFTVPADEIDALAADRAFSDAVPIVGAHYPCAHDPPARMWELDPLKTFWANEDFSTIGGDWAGASCWARSLVQNFVKLNATSTVSWATLWAAPASYRYFGNGLLYATQPWSGSYLVPPAIWTTAHVTQFAAPGWRFLDGDGAGLLPGGGSWTAMVPPPSTQRSHDYTAGHHRRPQVSASAAGVAAAGAAAAAEKEGTKDEEDNNDDGDGDVVVGDAAADGAAQHHTQAPTVPNARDGDVSIVIEKLEGRCLRCAVPATTAEDVTFRLAGPLMRVRRLAQWLSNESYHFVRLPDVVVSPDGLLRVHVPRDTILTLTTTTGQARGAATTPPPAYTPFPLPHADSYDATPLYHPARYHVDNGGSFEVVDSVQGGGGDARGRVLLQASPVAPGANGWGKEYDPITSIGSPDWANYDVAVRVQPVGAPPAYVMRDTATVAQLPDRNGRRPPSAESTAAAAAADPIGAGAYAGVCVRQCDQFDTGYCLLVGAGLVGGVDGTGWVLQAGTSRMNRTSGAIIAHGELGGGVLDLSAWHRLTLSVRGQTLSATVDGAVVARQLYSPLGASVPPTGLASLRSGRHYSRFDDLQLSAPSVATATPQPSDGWRHVPDGPTISGTPFLVRHLIYAPSPPPGGVIAPARPRRDLDGYVGCAFTLTRPVRVSALARFAVEGTGAHTVTLYDASEDGVAPRLLAATTLNLSVAAFDRLDGYEWAPLAMPIDLHPAGSRGSRYYLLSSEAHGGDVLYDRQVQVEAAANLTSGWLRPVRCSLAMDACKEYDGPPWGTSYGPLNMLMI